MIELKNIGITFNAGTPDENEALKNINLKINRGDFITVIGSNGAGKSTLYNLIAGTLKNCAFVFLCISYSFLLFIKNATDRSAAYTLDAVSSCKNDLR